MCGDMAWVCVILSFVSGFRVREDGVGLGD